MKLIDLYFKQFKNYKENIEDNNEGKRNRRIIKHANLKSEQLKVIKYNVKVDEKWILNIEEGLEFIEKAIQEERQFIRTEGEVVDIEKVKQTQKESVVHLSKNSSLITKKPKEGEMLIPDKLYIVEKLSDYAVYENRFLYLLLTYLRDFIYQRLDKIKEKVTTYHAELKVFKNIDLNNRGTIYELNFKDTYKQDPYLVKKFMENDILKKLENIYYYVESLLQTPLMKEVSKTPMIKPPIVKTNVLRMNPNFRAALELYDYIMAYNKLGYEFLLDENIYTPFADDLSDNFSQIIELTKFTTYKFGNNVKDDLINTYNLNIKKKEEEDRKQNLYLIDRLQKRLKAGKISKDDYILELEKRNKELEKQNLEIDSLKQLNEEYLLSINNKEKEIYNLKDELTKLNNINTNLNEKMTKMISTHNEEMMKLDTHHQEEKNRLIKLHEEKINSVILEFKEEINELKDKHVLVIEELKDNHNLQLDKLKENHQTELYELENSYKVKIDEASLNYNNQINGLKEELISKEEKLNSNINKVNELENEIKQSKGIHYAIRHKHGIQEQNIDFTSRESFKELQEIRKAFNSFFKKQWSMTKKAIREEVRKESELLLKEEQKKKENNDKK